MAEGKSSKISVAQTPKEIPTHVPSAKAKRKRVRDDDGTTAKKKRPRHEEDESMLDLEAGINTVYAMMDSQLLADHLAQRLKRFGKDLSPVELSDLYIPAKDIKDTTTFEKPRITANLPSFLETFSGGAKDQKTASNEKGSPHTIVVAGAGLRAADLVRTVRVFQSKGITVSKLFAKHIKLQEAIDGLNKSRTNIAVGTPTRLSDLVENGALRTAGLRRIIVDASYIDQKKRGITDMVDTALPLVRWLKRKELRDRYGSTEDPLELLFF